MNCEDIVYKKNYIDLSRPELLAKIKENLSDKRFQHCLRVEQMAVDLAQRHGANIERASIAGVLHDYAKEEEEETLLSFSNHPDYRSEWIREGNAMWHGPLAAMLAQRDFGLRDDEIYWAVFNHTPGSIIWTDTAKLVFLADYLEPARKFPNVDKGRKLAQESLDLAVDFKFKNNLTYLIGAGRAVSPESVVAYNHWVLTHPDLSQKKK